MGVGLGAGVVGGGGVVAGTVLGAGREGGTEPWAPGSGAGVVSGPAGAPPLDEAAADAEAEVEADRDAVVGRGLGRWVAGATEVALGLGTPVGVAGPEAGPLCGSAVAGRPAPGSDGVVSEPFAARAAAPSPTTARPTTETTSRPRRRPDRRAPRRAAVRPPDRSDAAGTGRGSAGAGREAGPGPGAAGAGGTAWSGPVARAPQPGQASAPLRWRRQGAQ
ncbi:hypothetical protein ACFP0N_12960 [Kitasatospora aburaviensis]|uniref:Uncharacterized protein n=1 Tax=Kitasatospora aburaviensis TaxID=67265 RepID=A0ABW1EWA0_9ACTN